MINLTDVTLRDGLQSEAIVLPTAEKANLYQLLLQCSYSRLEVTSFSHPKWIPALADSEQFCADVFKNPSAVETESMVFIPNLRGLERSLTYPIRWNSFFSAATEAFHKKNMNMTRQEGMEMLKGLIELAHKNKRKCRVYVSTSFGCPYEGEVSEKQAMTVIDQVVKLQPDEIALSDTIGVASPKKVKSLCQLTAAQFPVSQIALHVHNTYGLALANIAAALEVGITQFDGSSGGLGGCPYARGASGNIPTEEIAFFLQRQGVAVHVNWAAIQTVLAKLSSLGFSLQSHLGEVLKKGGVLYGIS
ncbi:hydroxymethylglutaryl-CoA lyase [bacterium]|nr:hydroxymethylglutaryl-CoA lyase [bacterium]